jgi:GDP-L-fucose synthase
LSNFFENKKVLVTGASGFIGTNLLNKLVDLGAHVRGITYQNPPQCMNNAAEYLKLDLQLKENCLIATKDVDFVFMASANSSGAAVIENNPLTHLSPNVLMNTNMLEASYENKVNKFCFISSNTVYPVTDQPVNENDVNYSLFEKYYIVGWMKIFSEIMCKMYSKHLQRPMETLIVRPGNLYGPFDKFGQKDSKVIASLVRKFCENQNPIEVWGDGEDIKDFLYIDDFIEGMLLVFEKSSEFEVFNVASGKPVNIKQIVKILQDITKLASEIEFDHSKPTMIPIRKIDISKIIDKGWRPRINLEVGLEETVEWYLKNKLSIQ